MRASYRSDVVKKVDYVGPIFWCVIVILSVLVPLVLALCGVII